MDTDYLTCGQCLKEFPLQQITLFIQHKKHDCSDDSGVQLGEADLKCYYCPRGFMTAWGLLVHVQLTHSLRIFVEKSSLSITTQQHDLTHGHSPRTSPSESNISPKGDSGERRLLRSTARHNDLENESEYPIQHGEIVHDDIQTNDLHNTRLRRAPFIVNHEEMRDRNSFSEPQESRNLQEKTVDLDLYKSAHNIDKLEIPQTRNTASIIESRQTVYTTNHFTQTSALQIDSVTNKAHVLVKETLLQKDELIQENCHSHAECENEAIPQFDDMKQTENDARKQIEIDARKQIENDARKQIEKETRKHTEKDTKKHSEKDANSFGECKLVHDTVSSADQEEESTVDGEGSMSDCDVQGCGVTVIPGSHEDLQECCNAVVPKKRKRHMMLKHMPFSWSSSRYARRRMLQRSLSMAAKTSTVTQNEPAATGTNTIFIDVEPDALAALTEVDKSQNSDNPTNTSSNSMTENSVAEIKDVDSVPVTMLPPGSESRTKSLILQPGAIFSIPFSYSLPSSISGTSKSIPISIVQQGQSSGKLTGVNSVTKRTLIGLPIGAHNLGQGQSQIQDSRSQLDEMEMDDSHGELVIADSDVRRRKYPTSKPFKCDQCPMAFNQRIHLKKHMSKHTGIKPYKCGECDYSTVERSHLKVHIRVHTGEKPFKCTYCEYATAQNSTLKIHLKRHHGGKMFGCHDCEKTFTQIEQLEIHQTEHISGSVEKSVVKKKLPGMDISPGSESTDRKSPSKDGCTGASVHHSGRGASPSRTTSSSSEIKEYGRPEDEKVD